LIKETLKYVKSAKMDTISLITNAKVELKKC